MTHNKDGCNHIRQIHRKTDKGVVTTCLDCGVELKDTSGEHR